MTLEQIVQKYLEENNFAGLRSGGCGCSKDDLFPCGEPKEDCQAALFKPCEDCNGKNKPGYCPSESPGGCYYVPVKYGAGE